MIEDTFLELTEQSLPFAPTEAQREVILRLSRFLFTHEPRAVYMLRGYAGTGKTSLMSAVVRVLRRVGRDVVLLAPTGRAAKVLAQHSGLSAYTIHKEIYRQKKAGDLDAHFSLGFNKRKNAVFIVDEASMITNESSLTATFGTGSLLEDLASYVFQSSTCSLILIGDNAQLPPVGEDESPALSIATLRDMRLAVHGYQLTSVMRQAEQSGILWNATALRRLLTEDTPQPQVKVRFASFSDIVNLPGSELVETLEADYDRLGQEQVVVVTRSNKRAVEYNLGIRNVVFGRDGGLAVGDVIMVVRNNYYWIEQLCSDSKQTHEASKEDNASPKAHKTVATTATNFIANGDIAIVRHISGREDFYGLHFADVTLQFPDYDDLELDVRVLLDALTSEAPALTREQSDMLYRGVMEDYAEIRSKAERIRKLKLDPNYNALQIKYAYAVTCHKAQGGQWSHVYVDQGWLPPDGIDRAYLRWLYTAFTRATERLYLVNWPDRLIE